MGNSKLFIGNLDFGINEEELKTLLSTHGTVVAIKMHQKKGYAFVEMGSPEEALKAVKGLDGVVYKNRPIRSSLEMKARKAKKISVERFMARGLKFSKEKKEKALKEAESQSQGDSFLESSDSASDESFPDYPESQRKEGADNKPFYSKVRSYSDRENQGTFSRPEKKEWRPKKSSFSGKETRYGKSSSSSGAPKKEWSRSKPSYPKARSFGDRENQGTFSRPEKKEWTPKKSSYSGKETRYGKSSSSSGAPKKEWSRSKPSYPKTRSLGDRENQGTFSRPEKKEWAPKKSSYSGKETRYGKSSFSSGAPKKEWSRSKPSYPKARSFGGRENQDKFSRTEKKEWAPKKSSYSGKEMHYGKSPSSSGASKKEWSNRKNWGKGSHKTGDSRGKNSSSFRDR